jgi:hypothetical protein
VAADVRRTADRRAQQVSKHADWLRSWIGEGEEQLTLGVFVRIGGPASLGLHGRAERVAYLGLTTERIFLVTKNLKKIDTLPLRSGTLGHSVRLDRDFLRRPILKVRNRTGETRYRFKRGDASLAEHIANAMVSETYMGDDDLRSLLETLSPSARDDLRRVLIRDQAGRDAIASRLMRYQDQTGDDWADVIDFLTMYPDARRSVARLLGEIDAEARGHPLAD